MRSGELIGMATAAVLLAGCEQPNTGLNGVPMIDCEKGPKIDSTVLQLPQNNSLNIDGFEFIAKDGKIRPTPTIITVVSNPELAKKLGGVVVDEKKNQVNFSRGDRNYNISARQSIKGITEVEIDASCTNPQSNKAPKNK